MDRAAILRSLDRQRQLFSGAIVLTPVDSLPLILADRQHTAFLHGLYLTDKPRDRQAKMDAVIQFGGRDHAASDIAAIHALLASLLGAAESSLRLLAGLQAHAAAFMSIGDIGQTVLLLPEDGGGHFSTHTILARLGYRTLDLPIDYDRMAVDREATVDLVARAAPDFIFVDRSEGLRYEDFSFIGALEGPVKIFDASQYITPILTGHYDNPLEWGFDLMLFTLHKSFPGPQKAAIVSRESGGTWQRLVKGLSSFVSSSHAENTYLFGLALLRHEWLAQYSQRLLATAVTLELELMSYHLPVVARSTQGLAAWPATHHVWLRFSNAEKAFAHYEALAAMHIYVNYRKLPYNRGHGLRLGTTFSSVAGIDVADMPELADIMQIVLLRGGDDGLRRRVRSLAESARSHAILPLHYWGTP